MKELVREDPTRGLPPAASRKILRTRKEHDRALYNIRNGHTDVEDVVEFTEDLVEDVEPGFSFGYNHILAFVATVFEDLDDDLSAEWLEEFTDLDSAELGEAIRIAEHSRAERKLRRRGMV